MKRTYHIVAVWNEVKDLDPPIDQQWTEQDEDDLAEFENNGRFLQSKGLGS